MSANQLIAVAAVVVPSGTALLIGYWHRKQMRQVEEFRLNATAGLHPPPHVAVAWIKCHVDLMGGIMAAAVLVYELFLSKEPVTRLTIFHISLNTSFIFLLLA